MAKLENEWYERYYCALESSAADAAFCERTFGQNLGQHGFADMHQVQQMVDALSIEAHELVVDLGCGTGGIIAHIAQQTGAQAIGVDFVERAVRVARNRYGSPRLHFIAADIGQSCLQTASVDVIVNIDAAYFHPLGQIVTEMKRLLAPHGRMGILYTIRAETGESADDFDCEQLAPDGTSLAKMLHAHGLGYSATDVTQDDYVHAVRKKAVLEDLHADFVAEGNEFLYDNRYGEAIGAIHAINDNVHARYLYVAARTGE